MHSGDLAELEQTSLSKQEKEALLEVMERAKDFDKQISSRGKRGPSLEGQLQKWTNPLKGWQPRWFSVDQLQGVLHYYTSEDKKKQAPRGSLHLWGAVVAPSEEDSQTFTVNGANGEIYKLRAVGAKERQHWVSRLRKEVETCTNQPYGTDAKEGRSVNSNGDNQSAASPQHTSATPTRNLSKRLSKGWMRPSSSKSNVGGKSGGQPSSGGGETEGGNEVVQSTEKDSGRGLDNFPGGDAMLEVLTRLQRLQEAFSSQLQVCVANGELSATDQKVLLTRATSQAALGSVKDCLALMKAQMNNSDQDSAPPPLRRSPSTSPTHLSAGNTLSSVG